MADSYKISLGIDFNDGELKNIKKQLTNLTDNTHRVRIDIDNSRLLKQIEHAKKELKELNSAKGNQPSLTVNTQSLEKSLSRVADVIEEVRKSLGTLDDKSGMKSLLSSVNQIATALGKVENESDNLVKSLNALSKKDFNLNFGIKFGGGNAFSSNTAYGNNVRGVVIPQLRKQAEALMKSIRKQYSNEFLDWQDDTFVLDTLARRKSYEPIKTPALLQKEMADGRNLSKQMSAYREYIDLIEEIGKLSGVDIGSVTAGFSKTRDELIQGAIDIQAGVKNAAEETEESMNKMKQIFGGSSIDAEGLSTALKPISEDITSIRTALEGLSSGVSIDGLTQSFDRLSETLEKIAANAKLAQNILGNEIPSVAQKPLNLDDVIDQQVSWLMNEYAITGSKAFEEIRQSLVDFKNGTGNIDKVTSAISNNMKVVNEAKNDYKDLAEHIKMVNASGVKVHLPDSIRQEYGDDFRAMQRQLGSGRLGNAFTLGQGMDFESFIEETNSILGQTIDLSHGAEAAFGDLVRKINSTKGGKFLTGDDLFRSGILDMGDVIANVSTSLEQIENAEEQITRTSTASANTVVQNEERKQQAYRETKKLISDVAQESIDNVSSERMGKYFRIDPSDSDAFEQEMKNLVSQWTDGKGNLVDVQIKTRTTWDKEAEARVKRLHQAQVEYNNELGVTEKKTIAWTRIGTTTNAKGKEKALYGFAEVADQYSKSLGKTKVQTDKFIKQQKNAVSDLTNQINQLNRAAIDQNASRPIRDDGHLTGLKNKYDDIVSAIQRMGSASNDNDFQEERNNVRTLISEYKSLRDEYRNAENVSNKMKGTDLQSGVNIALNDLKKFKADAKDYPQLINTVNKLQDALNQVGDASSLNKFTDQLKVARSELAKVKAETIATNRKEKVGIDVSGATSRIADIQRISPEIDEFKAEINGAEVTVESLLNDLSKVNTAGDFSVVNKRLKAFEEAAQSAGIATRETAKEANSNFNKLKSLAKEMGKVDIELAKVDNVDDFNSLKRLANDLEAEYKDLYDSIGKNLNADQLRELDQIFANTIGAVRELNNEMARSAEASELTSGLERLKTIAKEINGLKFDIFKFEDADNIERASNQLNELENEAAELRATLQQKYNITSFDEVDNIARQGEEALNSLIAKAEEAKNKLAKFIKADIELGNVDNQMDTMIAKFNSLSDANDELRNSYNATEDAYRAMMDAANANTGDEVADRERLIQAEKQYAAALEKTNNLIKQQARADKIDADNKRLKDSHRALELDMQNWLKDNTRAAKEYGSQIDELIISLRRLKEAGNLQQVDINQGRSQFDNWKREADNRDMTGSTWFDQVKSKFKQYASYFSVAEMFMYTEQALSSMFEQVKLIDSAMTELKKVTDETDASYNQFLSNAATRAKEIGTTIDGLVSSTADFARLGYDFADAQGLAEVANIYAVVGDDIDGVEGATQSLISTLTAFKNEMGDMDDSEFALSIVDKMNEVANQYAISSGGIGDALQRSASSMMAANNSLDETIALITAANTVVNLCHAA